MTNQQLTVLPISASVHEEPFNLLEAFTDALQLSGEYLQTGDVLAVSSKYVAISEGRVVNLDTVEPGDEAHQIAERYNMNPKIAQLVLDDADHVFGGIPLGYLLTSRSGIIGPNAGLDRSNIPNGKAVLLPDNPYESARKIRAQIAEQFGVDVGVILTDSWLIPGRLGTTGIAIGIAGFNPIRDERGKLDLFGNPMAVTQVGLADSIAVCAQMVMGERDEANPFAIVRNTGIELDDTPYNVQDIAIDWRMDIYIESLTLGLLPDGAPTESGSAKLLNPKTKQPAVGS